MFKDSLQWLLCLDCLPFCLFFLGVGLSQAPLMSLTLSHEPAVIKTTAKEAFLPIAASVSTDHRLPRDFQQPQNPDINMASGGNTDHGHELRHRKFKETGQSHMETHCQLGFEDWGAWLWTHFLVPLLINVPSKNDIIKNMTSYFETHFHV